MPTYPKNKQGIKSEVKRRSFSLVEIVFAVMLLAMCGGACYYEFRKVYRERQQKEVLTRIVATLRQAYRFAQLSNAEVTVLFSTKSQRIKEISLSDDLLSDTKVKMHGTKPELLENVAELNVLPAVGDKDIVKLKFFPWGIVNPNTIIEVKFTNDPEPQKIHLENFLLQQVQESASETLYPKDLLDDEKEKKSVRVN